MKSMPKKFEPYVPAIIEKRELYSGMIKTGKAMEKL